MPRGFFGVLLDKAKGAATRRGAHEVDRGVKDVGRRVVHHPRHPVALPQDITLGRSSVPTGQRTNIGVPHDEGMIAPFLSGTVLNVTSSWLRAVKYRRGTSELEAWFLDGFHCTVRDFSEEEAVAFYRAPSKGGFWHDVVLGPGYVKGQPSTAAKHWY